MTAVCNGIEPRAASLAKTRRSFVAVSLVDKVGDGLWLPLIYLFSPSGVASR